jgi:hypothetical protein
MAGIPGDTVAGSSRYPLRLDIDYTEGPRNRLTVLLRIFAIIPIAIVLGTVSGGTSSFAPGEGERTTVAAAGGLLFLAPLLMIVVRQKYPRWWFDWNLQFLRFSTRVGAYAALLRDEYPSTDEEQAVHLDIDYPNVESDLNRWLPLVKWLLAIPHFIILIFLVLAAVVVTIIAWFAILFTGEHPRGLFAFVVGVERWAARVQAYALLLVTDEYPPFSLD